LVCVDTRKNANQTFANDVTDEHPSNENRRTKDYDCPRRNTRCCGGGKCSFFNGCSGGRFSSQIHKEPTPVWGRLRRGQARVSGLSQSRNPKPEPDPTRSVSADGATDDVARATFEDRELLRQFQELQTLGDDDKRIVKTLIDAFLAKRKIQELMAS